MIDVHSQIKPIIHVVDDDLGVRRSLKNLLSSAGFDVALHDSPGAFLSNADSSKPGCVILDIQFSDENGLDCQATLRADKRDFPVILMTGYADVTSSVRGLKAGAIDYLTKPIDDQALMGAIETALAQVAAKNKNDLKLVNARQRYASLTGREKEVMFLVNAGLMNKQVASELSLSEVTVKVYRGTLMRKMGVRTLADLVRLGELLRVDTA